MNPKSGWARVDKECPICGGELAHHYGRIGAESMYKIKDPEFHCRKCDMYYDLILVKGELKKNVH